MLLLVATTCLVYIFIISHVGVADYCEEAFKPHNATGKIVKFCITNSQNNRTVIYLEVLGNEEPGVMCTCDFEYTKSFELGSFGYRLKQDKDDTSEIRVGNAVSNHRVNLTYSEITANTTITFRKHTGTSRMCLMLVSAVSDRETQCYTDPVRAGSVCQCNEFTSRFGAELKVECDAPPTCNGGPWLISIDESSLKFNVDSTLKCRRLRMDVVCKENQTREQTSPSTVAAITNNTTVTKAMIDDDQINGVTAEPKRRVSPDKSDDGPGIPVIAGAAGGGLVVIIAIIVTVIICMRKRNASTPKNRQVDEQQAESNYYLTDNANYVSADAVDRNKNAQELPIYAIPDKGVHTSPAGATETDNPHYASPRDTYMDTNDIGPTRNIISGLNIGHDNAGYAVSNQHERAKSGSVSCMATGDGNDYNHLNEAINKKEPENIYHTIAQ